MKKYLLICMNIFVFFFSSNGNAFIVFEDDFDNGFLDDHWEISFDGTYSDGTWIYEEIGTELTVYSVGVSQRSSSQYHPPASVKMNHILSIPLKDFDLKTSISWEGTISAMKDIWFDLYDVTRFGFEDGWAWDSGIKSVRIHPENVRLEGVPLEDQVEIRFVRKNGNIKFYWDNELFLTGFNDAPLKEFSIRFDFFPYLTADFGIARIDYIQIENNQVSEPATVLMLSFSGLLLRKRK